MRLDMSNRFLASFAVVAAAILVVSLAAVLAASQGSATRTTPGATLRTPWGDPDLRGVWQNATLTPLQRSVDRAEHEFLTDEQLAEQEARAATNLANEAPAREGNPGTYNAFWRDPVQPTSRTSLIVDPPDGRLPPLTPAAETIRAARRAELDAFGTPTIVAGPEDVNYFERCLARGWPRTGGTYQSTYQIFQTPDHVVLVAEMVGERLFVPLDGRPHGTVRQWMGDSRGHWEDDTLVVETINFPDRPNSLLIGILGLNFVGHLGGNARNLRVVERYRRVDADTLDYQFTVDDPTTFARPWTAAVPMRTAVGPVFEYACHEGNYALENILRGARAQDQDR